jgi:hypothetical protein
LPFNFARRTDIGRPIRRGESGGRLLHLLYSADKAEALAQHGTDEALLLAGVAHRPTRSVDPAGERRVGHNPPAPDRGEQIVLAHHPFAVADKKQQKIEHLRF